MKTPNLTPEELDTEITIRARLLRTRPNDTALKSELGKLRRQKMALQVREQSKPAAGLAEISEAIMQAGERSRKARAAADKVQAKVKKNCPCHGKPCEEAAMGGRVCQSGVCVRMN